MPYFDGTGPRGLGPTTGRALGKCNQEQGCNNSGRGFGRGRGRGAFCRFTNSTETISPQERLKELKTYKEKLEAEIESLEKNAQ